VELISTGMMNLNAKLTGIDDDKLVTRLIEVWNFFWVQVLPYVEGVSAAISPSVTKSTFSSTAFRSSFHYKQILFSFLSVVPPKDTDEAHHHPVWTCRPQTSLVLMFATWLYSPSWMPLFFLDLRSFVIAYQNP
jgi:HbrB-like